MRYFFSILFLLACCYANGQVLRGVVVSRQDGKPMPTVTITNVTTQQSAYTNEYGLFKIAATSGDQIAFSYVGYGTIQRTTPPSGGSADMHVEMEPMSIQLQEYTLHNYTPYQKDSIAMRNLYGKELNVQPIKPTFAAGNGIAVNGLIGSAVQKISRGYKKSKKFKKEFVSLEQGKYIDTRYTPDLVASLTKFSGDTLAVFMNTYPMDYQFARYGTDLEVKAWIRTNYREYLKRPKETMVMIAEDGRTK